MFHALEFAVIVLALSLSPFASATETNPENLESYLREFHADPKKVMNAPLAKRDSFGRVVRGKQSAIGNFDTEELAKFRDRAVTRDKICVAASGRACPTSFSASRYSAPSEANQITSFVYNPNVNKNLYAMERAGQLQAAVPNAPWSDSFWPMKFGLTGRRWMDKSFPSSDQWIDNYNYYLANPTSKIPVAQLSPAEKYDLLVGDSALRLTTSQWGAGKKHHNKKGTVPSWAGLCHGWSPASIMVPNPKNTVTAVSPSGQQIPFYPSDIKALAALSWGEAAPKKRFVGTRCETTHPKEDVVGRVVDEGCYDVNPATWHMAVVHQIADQKRSFVMDATYDLQVWNYPVYSYKYVYFNPQTLAISKAAAGAVVPVGDFTIDKFKTYRSPLTKFVVGIAMDVNYSIPTQPSTKPIPVPLFHAVKYVYDLELDENGNILGGEWYSNFHPDFLWNPLPDSHPLSAGELAMPVPVPWNGEGVVPPDLRQAANLSSPRGEPVSVIVEALVQRSIAP